MECYSHSLLIEYKILNEGGEILEHKIYNHRLKQLVDRPKLVPGPRPNVVVGCAHMGFYFKHLPAIAAFIGAAYDEAELERVYHDFITGDGPDYDSDEESRITNFRLEGTRCNFALQMEAGEMSYFWHLWARDEKSYEEARSFMELLRQLQ
jgi:hypothetical protein